MTSTRRMEALDLYEVQSKGHLTVEGALRAYACAGVIAIIRDNTARSQSGGQVTDTFLLSHSK